MRKNSFLTFCFAFIPGAGQMYLGMMKKGLLIMLLFWGVCSIATLFSVFEFLLWFCPVIWFYSFFETTHAKWLDENQRHQIDERAFAFLSQGADLSNHLQCIYQKKPRFLAWTLIFFGSYMVVDSLLRPIVQYICRYFEVSSWIFDDLFMRIPSIFVAILIIVLGVRLLRGEKKTPHEEGYVEYKGNEQNV